MSVRFFRNNFLRKMLIIKNTPRSYINYSFPKIVNPHRLLFTTQCAFLSREVIQNLDSKLKQASEAGEKSVGEFMDRLVKNIVAISHAYKECILKEIKITEEATKEGLASSKWDELPKYRSKEVEFEELWNNFKSSINTLGRLLETSAMKHITNNSNHEKIISSKYQELKLIIINETEEIRKLHAKLIQAKIKSIKTH